MINKLLKTCCVLVFGGALLSAVPAANAAAVPEPQADNDITGTLQVGGDFSGQYLSTGSESGDVLSLSPSDHSFVGIENTNVLASALVINYAIMSHLLVGIMYSYMDANWSHDARLNSSGGNSYSYHGYTIFNALHFTATWLIATHTLLGMPGHFFFTGGIGPSWADTHHFNVWDGDVYRPLNPYDSSAVLSYFFALGLMMHLNRNVSFQVGGRYTDWGKVMLADTRPDGTNTASNLSFNPRARFCGWAPFVAMLINLDLSGRS